MTDADGRTITSRQYASRGSVNTLLANIYAWMGGLTQDAKYWEQAEHYASQVIDEFAGDYELENMTDLIGNVFGKTATARKPSSASTTTYWMMPISTIPVLRVNCRDRN